MSTKQTLFRISYVFAMGGGLVAVAGGWLLAQPSEGANIGAGLLIIGATALMLLAVVTCIIALIAGSTDKSKHGQEYGAERREPQTSTPAKDATIVRGVDSEDN